MAPPALSLSFSSSFFLSTRSRKSPNGMRCRACAPSAPEPHHPPPATPYPRQRLPCSDAKVANRNVWDFGWELAHEAVSRRPPIPLYTSVARTHMYTYPAKVWDLPIVQGPFSVAACPNPKRTFATFASLHGSLSACQPRHCLASHVEWHHAAVIVMPEPFQTPTWSPSLSLSLCTVEVR